MHEIRRLCEELIPYPGMVSLFRRIYWYVFVITLIPVNRFCACKFNKIFITCKKLHLKLCLLKLRKNREHMHTIAFYSIFNTTNVTQIYKFKCFIESWPGEKSNKSSKLTVVPIPIHEKRFFTDLSTLLTF